MNALDLGGSKRPGPNMERDQCCEKDSSVRGRKTQKNRQPSRIESPDSGDQKTPALERHQPLIKDVRERRFTA